VVYLIPKCEFCLICLAACRRKWPSNCWRIQKNIWR